MAHTVKSLPAMRETQIRSLDQEDSLEKEMATHSSILVWRIPWTEEPWQAVIPRITESDMAEHLALQTSTGCNLKYSQKRMGSGHKVVE